MPIQNLGADGWDFKEKHVQPDNLAGGENFISSESIVVAAGPSVLGVTNTTDLIPIGLLENATVAQNKQLQQLFEIGSRQSYFIPGRTYVQVTLVRVLFNGPSLLKAVTSWVDAKGVQTPPADPFNAADGTPGQFTGTEWEAEHGPFFISLASDFFNRPFGLGIVMNDSENDKYGGFYLENCNVQSHQFSLTGQQTVVMENAVVRCSELVPINWEPEEG